MSKLAKLLASKWTPRLLIAGLLLFMLARMISSAWIESPTNDEPANIPSGYVYLLRGDYIDGTHPPLLRYWVSIPLLIMHPNDFPGDKSWFQDWRIYGREFLYHNDVNSQALIFWPRLMVMLLTLVLGWLIGRWARARNGVWAGVLAVTLFTLDPNMLAHGHYVTTDMAVTLACFAAVFLFWRYLDQPSWPRLLAAALAFACAQITKFSAMLLTPSLLLIAALLAWYRVRRGLRPKAPWYAPSQLWVSSGVYVAMTALLILVAYRFEVRSVAQDEQLQVGRYIGPVYQTLQRIAPEIGETPQKIVQQPIPAYNYFKGLALQTFHTLAQNTWLGGDVYQYAMGMYSKNGWWWYFPLAFAVKTPLALSMVLVLCALLGGVVLWPAMSATLRGIRPAEPDLPPESVKRREQLIFLIAPIVVFMGANMASTINIGQRYLLPIYPFLYVLASRIAAPWPRVKSHRIPRVVSLVSVLAALPGSLLIHPHYLSFFNELIGPKDGYKYLADSNIDWGQDLGQLKQYLDRVHVDAVYIDVAGTIRPEDLGIVYKPIPMHLPPTNRTYLVAISVNELLVIDELHPQGDYAWLRSETPVARIGYTILIYKLANPN